MLEKAVSETETAQLPSHRFCSFAFRGPSKEAFGENAQLPAQKHDRVPLFEVYFGICFAHLGRLVQKMIGPKLADYDYFCRNLTEEKCFVRVMYHVITRSSLFLKTRIQKK